MHSAYYVFSQKQYHKDLTFHSQINGSGSEVKDEIIYNRIYRKFDFSFFFRHKG